MWLTPAGSVFSTLPPGSLQPPSTSVLPSTGNNHLGWKGVRLLVASLLPHLRALNLKCNQLGSKGLLWLVRGFWPDLQALQLCSSLTSRQRHRQGGSPAPIKVQLAQSFLAGKTNQATRACQVWSRAIGPALDSLAYVGRSPANNEIGPDGLEALQGNTWPELSFLVLCRQLTRPQQLDAGSYPALPETQKPGGRARRYELILVQMSKPQKETKQKRKTRHIPIALSQSQPSHIPGTPSPVAPLQFLHHTQSIEINDLASQSEEVRSLPNRTSRDLTTCLNFKQKSTNIKTCVRFRPFSALQIQLTENGLGQSCVTFTGKNQVVVGKESMCFTLDSVYEPGSTQETIYNQYGRGIIEEIMAGYNGTLFAYGPTGSGKTYTMYGDLNKPDLAGVIPRSVRHIFRKIQEDEGETEFVIRCSILELYRQSLSDLIKTDQKDLKIKESPTRGFYVEGLSEVTVTSQQQLNDLIEKANKNKTVRATRLNQHSSRSHTLFTLQLTQRTAIGAELTGRLNLVDLAGSQKVSKSGAVGQSLEQAKKINLSLSCLGNVIHALTTNSQHVPYRDSKLTRLLQQSLGGNFKTSLIACVSMHESAQQQIISTLKFATRVKTIKNQFKMNVKSSSAGLSIIIQLLKAENQDLTRQNRKLRELLQRCQKDMTARGQKSELLKEILTTRQEKEEGKAKLSSKLSELLNNQGLLKSMGLDMAHANQIKNQVQTLFQNRIGHADSQPVARTKEDDPQGIRSFAQGPDKASRKLAQKELRALRQAQKERQARIHELQRECTQLKKQCFSQQTKLNQQINERKVVESKLKRELKSREYIQMESTVQKQQIQNLVDSLCKAEEQLARQLNETQELSEQRFREFLRKKLQYSKIQIQNYFKDNISFSYGIFQNAVSVDNMLVEGQPVIRKSKSKLSFIENVRFQKLTRSFSDQLLTKVTLRGRIESLETIFKNDPLAKDSLIYALKNELISAYFMNQQLMRIINALEWKQSIEYGKSQMRAKLVQTQAQMILNLQHLLDQSSAAHKSLRSKIQQVQFDLSIGHSHRAHGRPAPRSAHLTAPFKKADMDKGGIQFDETTPEQRRLMLEYKQRIQVVQPRLQKYLQRLKSLENQVLPLTYDNAIKAVAARNQFCKDLWRQVSEGEAFKLALDNVQMAKSVAQLGGLKQEIDRLQQRVLSLQTELSVQAQKSEHFKRAMQMEQAKAESLALLSREAEAKLRQRLIKECELMDKTVSQLTEYRKEEQAKVQEQVSLILRPLKEGLQGHPLTGRLNEAERQVRALVT